MHKLKSGNENQGPLFPYLFEKTLPIFHPKPLLPDMDYYTKC